MGVGVRVVVGFDAEEEASELGGEFESLCGGRTVFGVFLQVGLGLRAKWRESGGGGCQCHRTIRGLVSLVKSCFAKGCVGRLPRRTHDAANAVRDHDPKDV